MGSPQPDLESGSGGHEDGSFPHCLQGRDSQHENSFAPRQHAGKSKPPRATPGKHGSGSLDPPPNRKRGSEAMGGAAKKSVRKFSVSMDRSVKRLSARSKPRGGEKLTEGSQKSDPGASDRKSKAVRRESYVADYTEHWPRPPEQEDIPWGDQADVDREEQVALLGALKQHSRFYYMSSESCVIQGLQDWTAEEWVKRFEQHPEAAMKFCVQFLGGNEDMYDESHERYATAHAVKAKMDQSLLASQWQQVVRFQNFCVQVESGRAGNAEYYMEPNLFWNYIFDRDFPLGVTDELVAEPWSFVVSHSGVREIGHSANPWVTAAVYATMGSVLLAVVTYLLKLMVSNVDIWTFEGGTLQNATDAENERTVTVRTKDRGTVASILTSLSFSATVNALLDKYGQIDPSTSTVFIGMTLGGTFGFILDNQIGSDEGFREYLWSPQEGMKYALGALASARYGRYLITIVFDMFFTVILFKLLYSKLVRLSGFSAGGREWIANGCCSTFISVVTYQVYANMTRFEWAYPSGDPDTQRNTWISGQTMVLATVIMNMVYVVTETRVKVGEKGINDPPIKVLVTILTYFGIILLQFRGVIDPSLAEGIEKAIVGVEPENFALPLRGVCGTKADWAKGLGIFMFVAMGCLGFVIFLTSKQTLSGLKHIFFKGPEPPLTPTRRDRLLGKVTLYVVFLFVCSCIMMFFAVPFYSANEERDTDGPFRLAMNLDRPQDLIMAEGQTLQDGTTMPNTKGWGDSCTSYTSGGKAELRKIGLS